MHLYIAVGGVMQMSVGNAEVNNVYFETNWFSSSDRAKLEKK